MSIIKNIICRFIILGLSIFGTVFLCLPGLYAAEIEAGSRTTLDTLSSSFTTYTSFDQTFDEIPIVTVLMDEVGGNSATLRVFNVTRAGFDVYVTEPPAWDGKHLAVNFHYIAMTPGAIRLPGNKTIVAGRYNTTTVQHGANVSGAEGWDTISFGTTLDSTASVLATLQTMNNETASLPDNPSTPFLTVAQQNATASTVQLAIERSEASTGSVTMNETIGWIAFPSNDSGSFTDFFNNTINWASTNTSANLDGWNDGCDNNSFGLNSSTAIIVAMKNTHNSDEGGWLRSCAQSSTTIGLTVDEDTDLDNERNHVNEAAAMIAFDNSFHAVFPDPIISGTLFKDNGINTATAHDGLQTSSEEALGNMTVQLYLDATSALIQTTQTDGDGLYEFEIPQEITGQAMRIEITPDDFLPITETPGALPSLTNPSTLDNQIIFTPAPLDNYLDVNFGYIEKPVLTASQSNTIITGGSVQLPHSFTGTTDTDVTFSVVLDSENPAGTFSTTLYHDTDCSQSVDTGETAITSAISTSVGNDICLVLVVADATGAATFGTAEIGLIADSTFTGTIQTDNQRNTDIITITADTKLVVTKEVCNKDLLSCNALTGANFVTANLADPGQVLQYRLIFSSNATGAINNLIITDVTPEYTALVPGSATVIKNPIGINCTLSQPAGGGSSGYAGSVVWNCNDNPMLSGDNGILAYDVEIIN